MHTPPLSRRRPVSLVAVTAILGLLVALAPGLLTAPARADSTTVEDVRAHHAATASYILDTVQPSGLGREWMAFGLARSGVDADEWLDTYYTNLVADVVADEGNLGSATTHARVVIALSAMGKDVTDVGGHNLVEGLADMSRMSALNSAVFGLIALDTLNHEVPEVAGVSNPTTRRKLLDRALALEITGGGWAFFGSTPDPDMTGMTLQALAPYVDTDPRVAAAVERGVATLAAIQRPNGAFASYGNESAESTVQALMALTALGIDPATDARFAQESGNPVSALSTFFVEGGGFWYARPGVPNGMSTEQGFYGLTDYLRFVDGKPSIYSMSVADSVVTTTTLDVTSPRRGAVTLKATVTGAGAAGTVIFVDGDSVVGQASLVDGSAILELTRVTGGRHTYVASFKPASSAFRASTSEASTVAVTKIATTTSVVKLKHKKKADKFTQIRVRARVANPEPGATTGTVRIVVKRGSKNVRVVKNVELNKNGRVNHVVKGLGKQVSRKGQYRVVVRYQGDPTYARSKAAQQFRLH